MKIAGKKVPKGTFLLFLSFTAVSLCLLLIVSAARAERTNNLSQNMMYSGHERNFYVADAGQENQWEEVMPSLSRQCDDFAIYVPIDDSAIVMRGICVSGRAQAPPMVEGSYFDFASSWTDTPKAVIGKKFRQEVQEREGKKYYTYQGTDFEVIGVMGTKEESRLDYMVMLDFKSAIRMAGINTSYVLDAGRESALVDAGKKIDSLFAHPASVMIFLEEGEDSSLIEQLLSRDAIMDTMYAMILTSFSLSTVLVTFIWLRFRRQLFFAWRLCGYEGRLQCLEISKRFYLAAGVGFAAGLFLMALLSLVMADIQVQVADALQAFGITVGLGTVILFLCYALDRRK